MFNRLEGAWEAITDEILASYLALIPNSWPGKKTYSLKIDFYLKDVRAKLASALDAITLTLSPS